MTLGLTEQQQQQLELVENGLAFPAPTRKVGDGLYEWHLIDVGEAARQGIDVTNVCPPPSTWPEWMQTPAAAEAWHGWQRSRV